jgi:hypothetical protein
MIGSEPDLAATADELSVRELLSTASEQLSTLVRLELRSAQAEVTRKAKSGAAGAGLFAGAGMVLVFALQALVIAAIAALALVLPTWAGALIVAFGLVVVAGIAALAAKRKMAVATPPMPAETIQSVKTDAEEIVERAHRQ